MKHISYHDTCEHCTNTLTQYTPWVKKGCHPNHGHNFVNSWSIC